MAISPRLAIRIFRNVGTFTPRDGADESVRISILNTQAAQAKPLLPVLADWRCLAAGRASCAAAPDQLPAEGAEASSAARTLYGDITTMETSLTVQVGEPVVVLSLANTVKL